MARSSIVAVVALWALAVEFAPAQEAKPSPYTIPTHTPPTNITIPAAPISPPRAVPMVQFPNAFPALAPSREHYNVPAKVELNDGTTLAGDLHSSSPLQCQALFGLVAIPFNQIKGVEWQRKTDEQDEPGDSATLILLNGDKLTVTVNVPAIQLKTTWGHATVELPQVRSIVMTIEKVKWADTPTGRALVPDDGQ